MKDEDAFNNGKRVEGGIRTAVRAWCANETAAKAQYGPIASWDTSEITDMSRLFWREADFNGDISRWDVSNVTSLECTFYGATSFNQQLGGSWSSITGRGQQLLTFGGGCPGSIV